MADNAVAWEMLEAELVGLLSNDPTQFRGLQMVSLPIDALWNNLDWGLWLSFETADNIPLWGPVYQASVGNHITDAYLAFLTNIDASALDNDAANETKNLGPQLSAAHDELQKARKQISVEWSDFNNRQKNLPPQSQQNFDTWFTQFWGQKMNVLQNNYQSLADQWVAAANKAGGDYQVLAQAMQDYNNPDFQFQVKDLGGATQPYRMWNLTPFLGDFVSEAQAGRGSAFSLKINNQSDTSSVTSWGGSTDSNLDLGLIGIGAGENFQRTSVDTSSQNFAIAFSAKSFTGIQIMAGQWFHQNVVIQFQNGPFIASGPFGPGKAVFFGPTGTFNLAKTTVYVAYQPSIVAAVDPAAYSQVKQAWNAGQHVAIGPFSFGGGRSSASDQAIFDDTNQTMTFASSSPHPQIIAVNCTILPG